MGAQVAAISGLEELRAVLGTPSATSGPLVLQLRAPLGSWLPEAVEQVRATGRPVCVELVDPGDEGEVRAGREIGAAVALLGAGVAPEEIAGIEPRRTARVAEIVRRWHGGRAP